MMKIGCNTVAFRTSPLDFALEKIANAGYEYVEIEANLKWFHMWIHGKMTQPSSSKRLRLRI